MTDQTTTTGTESPDDGNELDQSASTAPEGSDDRNAESGEEGPDWKALAISLQEKAKKVNDLERRLAELEGGSQQPPVAESPEVQQHTEQIEQLEERAEEFRRRGDPVAAHTIETRAELLRTQRALVLQRQLDRMRLTEEEEKAVVDHFSRNTHRLGDYRAARAELREKALERENAEMKKRLELLSKPPDPDVMRAPRTDGREVGARETKLRTYTRAEWESEQAKLEEGDYATKMARQSQLRAGKIVIKG